MFQGFSRAAEAPSTGGMYKVFFFTAHFICTFGLLCWGVNVDLLLELTLFFILFVNFILLPRNEMFASIAQG